MAKLTGGEFDVPPSNPINETRNEQDLASFALGAISVIAPDVLTNIMGVPLETSAKMQISTVVGLTIFGALKALGGDINPWYVLSGGLTIPVYAAMSPLIETVAHGEVVMKNALGLLGIGLSSLTSIGVSQLLRRGVQRVFHQ